MKALSVFTGAGGMALGVEAAGYEIVGTIEIDRQARKTVERNRQWHEVGQDIADCATRIKPDDLQVAPGELALVAAGPPCQPYSRAAARWSPTGINDPRATIINNLMTIVETFLPKAVLLENVPSFTKGNTAALEVLNAHFQHINEQHGTAYQTETLIVDAADYGVAQHRRRSIVIALQTGEPFNWPTKTHQTRPMRAWDAIGQLNHHPDEIPELKGKWADLLPSIPEGSNYLHHTSRGPGLPLFGYRQRFWHFLLKLAKHRPSWTLTAQPGPATGPFHWNNRPLTTREMLRLQSFPETWVVEGNRPQQTRQIGNATPPLLAETIATAINTQTSGKPRTGPPHHTITRQRKLPAPEPAQPVPAAYHQTVAQQTEPPY